MVALEIDDALEHDALDPLPGEFGEESLDGIEPGHRGWGEVEMKPLVPFEPGAEPRDVNVWRSCSTIWWSSRLAGVSRLILLRKWMNSLWSHCACPRLPRAVFFAYGPDRITLRNLFIFPG